MTHAVPCVNHPLTFLIAYNYNPISISRDVAVWKKNHWVLRNTTGELRLGDPRMQILMAVARELRHRGHHVVMMPVEPGVAENFIAAERDAATRIVNDFEHGLTPEKIRSKMAAAKKPKASVEQKKELAAYAKALDESRGRSSLVEAFGEQRCIAGDKVDPDMASPCVLGPDDARPDFAILWSNYNGVRGSLRSAPSLVYENGFTGGSVVVDPRGLLGDAFYRDSLNSLVQRNYDDARCRAHVQEHRAHDSSKRLQSSKRDIPTDILGRYVFVATQKFDDVSVRKHSNVTYPDLLRRCMLFCQKRGWPLVVKIHPHLVGKEHVLQERLIRGLNATHRVDGRGFVFESKTSINYLTSHARFTVTLNGGTLVDNFYTGTPVLSLARSLFEATDAVVRDNDVESGLERMEHVNWSDTQRLRQRQIVCWYEGASLNIRKAAAENIAVLESHFAASLQRDIAFTRLCRSRPQHRRLSKGLNSSRQPVTAAEFAGIRPASSSRWISSCLHRCLHNAKTNETGGVAAAENATRTRCQGNCERLSRRYVAAHSRRSRFIDTMRDLAQAEASAVLQRMNATLQAKLRTGESRSSNARRVCDPLSSQPPGGVFPTRSREIVAATVNKPYRYYSLIEHVDSTAAEPISLLVFKSGPLGSVIHYGRLRNATDLAFEGGGTEPLVLFPRHGDAELRRWATDERRAAHNLAVANVGGNEYMIVGGLGPLLGQVSDTKVGQGDSGIRMARGRHWPPWSKAGWQWKTNPSLIITPESPGGCVDFRLGRIPPDLLLAWQLGNATLAPPLCEFDGRLSIVKHRKAFRLYARTNLLEGATFGGRFVQTTSSPDGETNWTRWQPIRIHALPAGSADIYFFHAQPNPIDGGKTMLALFPISQPPHACIGLAFSRDGVSFSAPFNLQVAPLVWRSAHPDGTGPIEWRNVDHPVAGAVLRRRDKRPGGDEIWFYIHHGVLGTSMLPISDSHVALYRLQVKELRRMMATSDGQAWRQPENWPVPWERRVGIG